MMRFGIGLNQNTLYFCIMKQLLLIIGLSGNLIAFGNQIFDTLFIHKDTATIGLQNLQLCVFNDSNYFKPFNHIIELSNQDTLNLHIVNNDTLDHTFTIDGVVDQAIVSLGSADVQLILDQDKAYRYYSDVSYGHLLGAAGVIMKGYENYPKFYWNMFEQSSSLSHDLADLTETSVPTTYVPDVFTINQKVYPETNLDTLGKVTGNVNDTLIITTINSGKMEHTLHFHGFHVEILYLTHNTKMIGWSKDTYPMEIDELVIVKLIPHQEGDYPVHEHNLLNVTTNGVYPGGMIEVLTIAP